MEKKLNVGQNIMNPLINPTSTWADQLTKYFRWKRQFLSQIFFYVNEMDLVQKAVKTAWWLEQLVWSMEMFILNIFRCSNCFPDDINNWKSKM